MTFTERTVGFGYAPKEGKPRIHWVTDPEKQLPTGSRAIRYEEDGYALFVVVELPNGDRKRVLVRDANGEYKF